MIKQLALALFNQRTGTRIKSTEVSLRANIGRYCSIGDRVVIGPGGHDMDQVSTSTKFQSDVFATLGWLFAQQCLCGGDNPGARG